MKIKKTAEGKAYLFLLRAEPEYERQKMEILREWTTIKFTTLPFPSTKDHYYYDVRRPLKFPDNSFDAVYPCHILEHLTLEEGKRFISEVFRVLKPGGICRLSLPELEGKVREYLKCLEEVANEPSERNILRYRWIIVEFIDQMVREKTGGKMFEMIQKGEFDPQQLKDRYEDTFACFLPEDFQKTMAWKLDTKPKSIRDRLKSKSAKDLALLPFRKIKAIFYKIARRIMTFCWRGDLRKEREALMWLHDRFSLKLLYEKLGFIDFKELTYKTSDIEFWDKYKLDQSNYGDHPIDPTIYLEARKP